MDSFIIGCRTRIIVSREITFTSTSTSLGPGDYMNEAPPSPFYVSSKATESTASYSCPVNRDNCSRDGGRKNPIHNFMSYVDVSLVASSKNTVSIIQQDCDSLVQFVSSYEHDTVPFVSRLDSFSIGQLYG